MEQEGNQHTRRSAMTRRRFIGTAAAALGAMVPVRLSSFGGRYRRIKDVQLGAISYSFRALPGSAEEILGYLVDLGLNTVELMGDPIERYAGAPEPPRRPRPFGQQLTEDERAAFREAMTNYAEEARAWRLSAPMERFDALRKMYNDAGVTIDIAKLGNPNWSDEEIDYAFNAAKRLGARGISLEISNEAGQRMGPFASKHKLLVGMHNHTQVGEEGFSFDVPLSYSPYNALNLDVGHYVAGTSQSPIPIIQKYADRISHLHLKDRKTNDGPNVPWGTGDTPLVDILRLLQKEQYPITAMIELEYEVPENSDVMTEMAKCVAFCKEALS